MTLSRAFEAVAGGVTGRDHRRAFRDGQDGYAVVMTSSVTAAIVTDGCSSGRQSEVGARLGAIWLADLVAEAFAREAPTDACETVTDALVERLRTVACSLAHREVDAALVGELLLFGFLVAVVTPAHATVFGVGDGFAWIDGRTHVIDPGPENAPSYAAYALLGAPIAPRVIHVGPSSEVDAIAVATDGAADLLAEGAQPSFGALMHDGRLLENPSLLCKRLRVLSERGLFFDDASVGLVRRRA